MLAVSFLVLIPLPANQHASQQVRSLHALCLCQRGDPRSMHASLLRRFVTQTPASCFLNHVSARNCLVQRPGAHSTTSLVTSKPWPASCLPATLGSLLSTPPQATQPGRAMATASNADTEKDKTLPEDVAILGGGCFWCLEACFQQLKGVSKVVSAYAGGHVKNPTYEQVCGKQTGHAEVVAITFDPKTITYTDLLNVFFTIHDPTTPNRQGADVGPQYRSIIIFTSKEQEETAKQVMSQVNDSKMYPNPVVTELVPFEVLYDAEDYHQNYYKLHPDQGYCNAVITPKVAKFRNMHMKRLMADQSV